MESAEVMAKVRSLAPESLYYMDTQAQALLELGRIDEARDVVEALRQAEWSAPDLWELVERSGL